MRADTHQLSVSPTAARQNSRFLFKRSMSFSFPPSNRRFWKPYKANILSEEPELPVWGIFLLLFSNPRITECISYTLSAPSHTYIQTKRFQEQNGSLPLLYHSYHKKRQEATTFLCWQTHSLFREHPKLFYILWLFATSRNASCSFSSYITVWKDISLFCLFIRKNPQETDYSNIQQRSDEHIICFGFCGLFP